MKTYIKFLTSIAAMAFLATGCSDEDPAYNNKPTEKPDPEVTEGYLATSAMNLRVVLDTQTDTQPDDTGNETQRPSTRAAVNTDSYIVEIFDEEGATTYKSTYAQLQALTEPLALAPGNYRIEVRSEDVFPATSWEKPYYKGAQEFSIVRKQTTTINGLTCTLANIKVTLACSVDLSNMLSDTTTATVSLGANQMVFGKTETRAAYFKPAADLNTLQVQLQGSFKDSGKPVQFNKTIPNVKAGQWRKITLIISYSDKGDVQFDIQVDNFILDDEVTVDGTEGMWEPELSEEPATPPTVVWTDHDIEQQYDMTSDLTVELVITAEAGLKKLVVTIDSDFLTDELLGDVGIPSSFDLCNIQGSLAETLGPNGLGFPINEQVRNQTSLNFSITSFVPIMLALEGNGKANFILDITDNEGNQLQKTVKLLKK